MGHATRCVPIIEKLLSEGNTIFLAGSEVQHQLFKSYFSNHVHYLISPSYSISYSRRIPLFISVLLQMPKIFIVKRMENFWLRRMVKDKNIEVIISDNRFGMYNKRIQSIYITHQLNVKTPYKLNLAKLWHQRIMKNYNEIWVPDSPDGISGELTSPVSSTLPPVKLIGILSALRPTFCKKKENQILVLLSGPEPQRGILEEKLLRVFNQVELPYQFVMVCGNLNNSSETNKDTKVKRVDWVSGSELSKLIEESRLIVCRSGYSTLMDLCVFGSSALLIPTPGQTEQEYLAQHCSSKFGIPFLTQNNLTEDCLKTSIEEAMKHRFPVLSFDLYKSKVKI